MRFGSKFSNTVQMSNSEFDKWVMAATRNGLAHVTPSDDMMLCYTNNEHIGTYFPESEILYTDDVSLFGSYVESKKVDTSRALKEAMGDDGTISSAPSGRFRNVCKDYLNGDMDVEEWMDYAFEAIEDTTDEDAREELDSNEDDILEVFGEDPQYYQWWGSDDVEEFTQGAWEELRRLCIDCIGSSITVETKLNNMFPEISQESRSLLADWYNEEGTEAEEITKSDVIDMIWASTYTEEIVQNLISELIDFGYFDEDDMPVPEEEE